MAVLNPQHLLEQAELLLGSKNSRGVVRQVNRRRAISASYYSVFHTTLTAMADEFTGRDNRSSSRYALVYRSIDHKSLYELCKDLKKQTVSDKFKPFVPEQGFGENIRGYAALLMDLKELRNSADYDPSRWITLENAKSAISLARSAIEQFMTINENDRRAFLTLLAFPPRPS